MTKPFSHKRLVSAFIKAGCTVEELPRHSNHSYLATNPKNGKSLEWHTQAAFVPATKSWDESNPVTTYVVARSPYTDAMTDCFCDSFYDTIKGAVKAIQN